MDVLCVIGDIVGSRTVPDRNELQQRLVAVLKELNTQSPSQLASPYTITLGDEFQAVLSSPVRLFQGFWRILEALFPCRARFAVGIGPLATPINPDQAIGMDGPGFHRARSSMDAAREAGVHFRLKGAAQMPLINAALDVLSPRVDEWRRNRISTLCRLYAGEQPNDIASRLGISLSGVYKNIRAGHLEAVMRLTREIESVIAASADLP